MSEEGLLGAPDAAHTPGEPTPPSGGVRPGLPGGRLLARAAIFLVCAGALLLTVLAYARWIYNAPIEMDELEFVRATRWVAEGKIPYLDFWEHHFPLQWYLMAPLALLVKGASLETFRVMRAGNTLFLAGSALLFFLTASLGGRRRLPGAAALLLLISGEYFVVFTSTFRIDGPMCFFYLLGLYLLEKGIDAGERAGFYSATAGAVLAFSGLCSQRAIPGVVVAALLYLFVRPGERWGLHWKAAWAAVSGSAIALLVAGSWGVIGGFGTFWNQNVVTNRLYEKLPAGYELPSFRFWLELMLRSSSVRVLTVLAAAGVVLALVRFGKPTFGFRLAILAGLQLAFLSTISSPFGYQLQLFFWLLALLAVSLLDALRRLRRWPDGVELVALVLLLLAGSGRVTWRRPVFPNFLAVQEHQGHVLKRLEEVTAPGETILDGCGWGLNRESAFVFWFLPRLVRVLTAHGAIVPLTERELIEKPPAAIVMDSRTVLYLKQVRLQPFVSSHYVPLERAIWVPGLSGKLGAGEERSWTVLTGGRYRLVESARHAGHPWFLRSFDFPRNTEGRPDQFVVDLGKEQAAAGPRSVEWTVDGRRAGTGDAAEVVTLEKGSRLTARNAGGKILAVFAVPSRWNELMAMPCAPAWFEPSEEW